MLVTFESNWKQAKEILSSVAQELGSNAVEATRKQLEDSARTFDISYSKLDPVVYTRVEDSGVLLTVRYLTNVRRRRFTEQRIWERVLEKFKERDDIDFAYPTRRYYQNHLEGKPEAGGQKGGS